MKSFSLFIPLSQLGSGFLDECGSQPFSHHLDSKQIKKLLVHSTHTHNESKQNEKSKFLFFKLVYREAQLFIFNACLFL